MNLNYPTHSPRNLLDQLKNMFNNNNEQIQQLQDNNLEIIHTINIVQASYFNNNIRPQPNRNRQQVNNSRQVNNRQQPINNRQLNNQTTDNLPLYDIHFIFPGTTNSNLNNFFEPIDIFPTIIQIENATQIIRFGDIIQPNNSSCPILLDSFNENSQVSMIRHCRHIFTTQQLNSWFRTNCRCPVCRYDIRTYEITPSTPINQIPINQIPINPISITPPQTPRNRNRPSPQINDPSTQINRPSTQINDPLFLNDTSFNLIIQDMIQEILTPTQTNLINQGFSNIINTLDPSNNIPTNLRNLFLPYP